MEVCIERNYNAPFIPTLLKDHSIVSCGTANLPDVDSVYTGFTKQGCRRSWKSLIKQQFHGLTGGQQYGHQDVPPRIGELAEYPHLQAPDILAAVARGSGRRQPVRQPAGL